MTITEVYDTLLAQLAAKLGPLGYNVLPHAYVLDKNPETMLKQGYALAVGPGLNTKKLLSEAVYLRREFLITLVRSLDSTDLDSAGKQSIEKTLLEDWRTIIVDLESNTELGFTFESDEGIQYIQPDKDEFIYLQMTVSVEYIDSFCCG